jgi:hypothetical protein
MGWNRRWYQEHSIQIEGRDQGKRDSKVPLMERIESSAIDTDAVICA